MSGYTLTWKHPSGSVICPGDGAFLRPDKLCTLEPAALAALPVAVGRGTAALGDFFAVQRDFEGPPEVLKIEGLPPWDRLGAGMERGELHVHGDVGDDLGASMGGGRIHVTGRAGRRAGGPDYTAARGMTGGEIVIEGEAGDYPGLRMRRGLIAIRGRAGASPGCRMLAGTVVVGLGPLDAPGLEMRRGTILSLDRKTAGNAPTLAHLAAVGTFSTSISPVLRLLLRRLSELGWAIDPAAFSGQYHLSVGDCFELGKGELWQWVN